MEVLYMLSVKIWCSLASSFAGSWNPCIFCLLGFKFRFLFVNICNQLESLYLLSGGNCFSIFFSTFACSGNLCVCCLLEPAVLLLPCAFASCWNLCICSLLESAFFCFSSIRKQLESLYLLSVEILFSIVSFYICMWFQILVFAVCWNLIFFGLF